MTTKINTRRWRKLRDRVVREEPVCRLRLEGCTHYSQTADHIITRSQAPRLAYVRSNLQGACHHCNDKRGRQPLSVVRPAPALTIFQ